MIECAGRARQVRGEAWQVPAVRNITGSGGLNMENALKGLLLSALVFPGLGHLVLKRTRRALVLMLVVVAALAVMATAALRQARIILENIEQAGGAVDVVTISQAAAQASSASGGWLPGAATLVLVFCWLFGAVDAWRIGRRIDQRRQNRAGAAGGQ